MTATKKALRKSRPRRPMLMRRSHKHWSEDEDKQLLFFWGTMTVATLAAKLDRSPFAVVSRATKLKLGSPSRGTKSMNQFCRETGYFPRQIHVVMKNLGMLAQYKIDTDPSRKRFQFRQFAISFDQEEAILEYLRKHPDSERIYCELPGYRTKMGKWGVGNKPPACLDCNRNDRPHRARGLCGACVMRQLRHRRAEQTQERDDT
jgi:hypothetical protein